MCDTAGSQQGGMEERAVGMPGRAWPLTQPRWHLLGGEGISEAQPSCGQRSQGTSTLLLCSTASILKSKARVPRRAGGFALQSKAQHRDLGHTHLSCLLQVVPVGSPGRLQVVFFSHFILHPCFAVVLLAQRASSLPGLSALLAVAERSPCRGDAPCSPRRRARRSGSPRLCPRRPCTPRSAPPRPPPRSPSAVGPTGRERSSVKGLQTHEGRHPVVWSPQAQPHI